MTATIERPTIFRVVETPRDVARRKDWQKYADNLERAIGTMMAQRDARLAELEARVAAQEALLVDLAVRLDELEGKAR